MGEAIRQGPGRSVHQDNRGYGGYNTSDLLIKPGGKPWDQRMTSYVIIEEVHARNSVIAA